MAVESQAFSTMKCQELGAPIRWKSLDVNVEFEFEIEGVFEAVLPLRKIP